MKERIGCCIQRLSSSASNQVWGQRFIVNWLVETATVTPKTGGDQYN
jgi:hypothetical protein